MFRKMLMLMLGLVMATFVVGCNTVSGVGKDVQSGGKAITHTANEVSDRL
ncbi:MULTISPECIES: entericidin A/B family lipoprotein [unclassified Gilliamella]|nr:MULTISPECIES: entericidin A/B family lipoprotein [unclassified Gilliamella]